jgi:nicotinamidase-related amidase
MPHPNLLERTRAALIVIDIQEAFRSAVPDFALIASRASTAVRGFQVLEVPTIITEQYPKGLGRTAEEVQLVLNEDTEVFEKTAFSSCGAANFLERLEAQKVDQVAICGLETHVCVSQTAHDLLDRGFQVHLLADCVASRFGHDKEAGLAKMKAGGVVHSSIEMALFELMRDSTHEKFKEVQALIR